MARAPVSKTGGCRFESCHSCHTQKMALVLFRYFEGEGQKPPR
jgi:hypothetical protein